MIKPRNMASNLMAIMPIVKTSTDLNSNGAERSVAFRKNFMVKSDKFIWNEEKFVFCQKKQQPSRSVQTGHRKKSLNGCLSNARICHPINGQTKQYRPKWSAHKWTGIHADNGVPMHIEMGKVWEKISKTNTRNRIEIECGEREKKNRQQAN